MHRTLSWYDIKQIPEARKIFESEDKEAINNLLFKLGFDIKRGVEVQYCKHRPLSSNKPILDDRWVGVERKDEDWVKSGNCTYENNLGIVGIKDVEFQAELLNMCRYINYTAMVVDHMKSNSEEYNIKFVTYEGEDVDGS